MEVRITPDAEQEAFIRQAIESGRLHQVEDAVREALNLWKERERRRHEILTAVDQAESSLARGEGCGITSREGAMTLSENVKRRSLARLTSEQTTN